jgi:hypothetical protein
MTTFIVTVTLAVIVLLVVFIKNRVLRGQSRFADGHVGKIGERLDLMVTLFDVIAFQKWGRTRHRFRFQDAQGHCLVWWSDIYEVCIPIGARGSARLTITEHAHDHGTDETIVRNVRVRAISDQKHEARDIAAGRH